MEGAVGERDFFPRGFGNEIIWRGFFVLQLASFRFCCHLLCGERPCADHVEGATPAFSPLLHECLRVLTGLFSPKHYRGVGPLAHWLGHGGEGVHHGIHLLFVLGVGLPCPLGVAPSDYGKVVVDLFERLGVVAEHALGLGVEGLRRFQERGFPSRRQLLDRLGVLGLPSLDQFGNIHGIATTDGVEKGKSDVAGDLVCRLGHFVAGVNALLDEAKGFLLGKSCFSSY